MSFKCCTHHAPMTRRGNKPGLLEAWGGIVPIQRQGTGDATNVVAS